MLHRIREPFGKAGLIVAVVALVAALVGGAYAAGGLTSKERKEVRTISRQFAGSDGGQGPVGQIGPQGPKGDSGPAGAAGADGIDGEEGEDGEKGEKGKNGESVNVIPLTPGNGTGNCEKGGAKFVNGTGEAFACDGEDGEGGGGGGYPETLPSGRTMSGLWEVLGAAAVHVKFVLAEEWAVTTISFPLPLATVPTETVLIDSGATEEQKTKCPGNFEHPKATVGVLCLYKAFGGPVVLQSGGPTAFGAGLFFAETDKAFGSWAVKAG